MDSKNGICGCKFHLFGSGQGPAAVSICCCENDNEQSGNILVQWREFGKELSNQQFLHFVELGYNTVS
jgi:hypothetical protein